MKLPSLFRRREVPVTDSKVNEIAAQAVQSERVMQRVDRVLSARDDRVRKAVVETAIAVRKSRRAGA